MDTVQSMWRLSKMSAPQANFGELVCNTKIGLEVEVEGVPHPERVRGWKVTTDGSLRNEGVEYVFNGPIGGAPACKRISDLHNAISSMRNADFSVRTSLHVHMDVRDLSWNQVMQIVILYAMVEPYLFSICGNEREESIYSLSLYRGKQQIQDLSELLRLGPGAVSEGRLTKYTALNLLSLPTFGSLEFRGHKGTSDKRTIINWVNHLLSLKKYVLDPNKKINDLPKILSTDGHIAMLREIFNDKLVVANIKHANSVRRKIYEGVNVGEDLLFSSVMRDTSHRILTNNRGQGQMDKLKDKLCVD